MSLSPYFQPTEGGDTVFLCKPVSESCQTVCSPEGMKPSNAVSPMAMRRYRVTSKAAHKRPRTAAVGMTSPFSRRDNVAG